MVQRHNNTSCMEKIEVESTLIASWYCSIHKVRCYHLICTGLCLCHVFAWYSYYWILSTEWLLRVAFGMQSGNKIFTEMLPALRVSDKALERQEVCYFQPRSGERSIMYAGGHRGWDWHDTCVGQLWPLTKGRIKCLIIGRAAAESPEEQWRLGLIVSTLVCVWTSRRKRAEGLVGDRRVVVWVVNMGIEDSAC